MRLTAHPQPDRPAPAPARRSRSAALAIAFAASAIAIALAGCSPIEPWVKPYQREHLADPIMSFDPHPASAAYLDHVYDVRQAARGGTGAVGGGCGCN
ncbi:MAG TPA: DUF4266 domain-containing protein [Steroidobacteraceae bacterium]|nr:DUF4266 domain-containing protein [Steroidobacteraceae bacterium]